MQLTTNKKQGVVLLFAVLMVSIVLTISLSLLNITFKQIILTAVNKESQTAHFVALSALDCALFTNLSHSDNTSGFDAGDNPFGVFISATTLQEPNPPPSGFSCGSGDGLITAITVLAPANPASLAHIDASGFASNATGIISKYKFSGLGLGSARAEITVVKVSGGNYSDEFPNSDGDDIGRTFYAAIGFNTDNLSNPRLVARSALKVE